MNAIDIQEQARLTADEVARRSYGKLVAFLAARTCDVAAAEDALSEAFAAALTEWPKSGPPSNPEAWLLTVARRKAIDAGRRQRNADAASGDLQIVLESLAGSSDTDIPDRRLALMFACAHPSIEPAVRGPLILQVVLGFDAKVIASAFLVSPSAMGKRLVRAKNKIRLAGIPFRIPGREELPARLDAVLDSVYATYSAGWSDPVAGDLTGEAVFLATLIASMLPEEPEALGLVSLILYAESRRAGRRSADGEYVPFDMQDPALWDVSMIERAEASLRQAHRQATIGRFQLEAAIQSAHVHRRLSGEANWPAVVHLYDTLSALIDSPVVAINRALAIAEVSGPEAALKEIAVLSGDTRLNDYQPWWAARAGLLSRAGACDEARKAYDIAVGLERDPAVRRFLQKRQSELPA